MDLKARLAALKNRSAAAAAAETKTEVKTEVEVTEEIAKVETPAPAVTPVTKPTPADPLDALDAAWDTVESPAELEKAAAVQVGVDLHMKLVELEDALINAHPKLPTLLKEIHSRLRSDADVVSMLEPSQIGVVVTALRKFQGIELLQKATKSKTVKANLKNVSVDDL